MASVPVIRLATRQDLAAITDLVSQLGYPGRPDGVAGILDTIFDDDRHQVLVAEDECERIVALLSLSSRPVLRLEGWVGTVEELIVKPGRRGRGVGDRLLQYAKGLAAERGFVRLEATMTQLRESHRRGFLLSRGFVTARCVTYRGGPLEGRHQTVPVVAMGSRDQVA